MAIGMHQQRAAQSHNSGAWRKILIYVNMNGLEPMENKESIVDILSGFSRRSFQRIWVNEHSNDATRHDRKALTRPVEIVETYDWDILWMWSTCWLFSHRKNEKWATARRNAKTRD